MRFLSYSLATSAVLASNPANMIVYQNNICKVLTGSVDAACVDNALCHLPAWGGFSSKRVENVCSSKAVYGFEAEFDEIVKDAMASIPAIPRNWLTRRDCQGFFALFSQNIDALMATVVSSKFGETLEYACAPDALVTFVNGEDAVNALQGVLEIYSIFPLGLPMDIIDGAFTTKLVAAAAAYPYNIITEPSMAADMETSNHAFHSILGYSATESLLLRATEPVNLSFVNVMDLIMKVHSHLRWAETLSDDSDEMVDEMHAALSGLQAVIIKMVQDMKADSEILAAKYHATIAAYSNSAQALELANIETELRERSEWYVDHYKAILVYFIYQSSRGLTAITPRANARWHAIQ